MIDALDPGTKPIPFNEEININMYAVNKTMPDDDGFKIDLIEQSSRLAVPNKYQHPGKSELLWSGRGRRPIWVDELISEGYELDDLLIDKPTEPTPAPSMGELVTEENSNFRHGGNLEDGETSLAIDLGINLSLAAMDLIQEAAMDMGKAATLLVRSGLLLLAAKKNCQHGEFNDYCAQIGIAQNRASEAMLYAQFAAQLPENQRSKYLLLPKKSALLLGNADPAVIELLLSDDTISATSKIRTKTELTALARHLVETEDALNRTAAENEALHEEVMRLKESMEPKVAGSEYPLHVVTLRKEGSVLSDEAIACLSSIRNHADEFLIQNDASTPDTFQRNLEAGLVPALAGVASILQSALTLLNDMEQQTGLSLHDLAGRITQLPTSELEIIETARENMLARKEGRSLLRQSQYAANGDAKRGRGRPKKIV